MEDLRKHACAILAGYNVVFEYRFMRGRRWRIDIAVPDDKLAIEIEGGALDMRGRHTRRAGFAADIEKYNALSMLGWTLLRTTTKTITATLQQARLWLDSPCRASAAERIYVRKKLPHVKVALHPDHPKRSRHHPQKRRTAR